MKTQVEGQKRRIVKESRESLKRASEINENDSDIAILHISDLHVTSSSSHEALLQPLIADLTDRTTGLGLDRLDYLVVSGDLSNRGAPEEFEIANKFITGLVKRFNISAERCVIVPGNHDVDWETSVYDWKGRRSDDTKGLPTGSYVDEPRALGVRNRKRYPNRFMHFSECFYHPLIQIPYPTDADEQCIPFLFPDSRLQFIAINSCWEIDEFFPKRCSVNGVALARGLELADEQVALARGDGLIANSDCVLRIAVWHHAVTGNEAIKARSFLDHLAKSGVKVVLHGDVHEERAGLINYLEPTNRLHVVGAGAFGAAADHRPESTANHYHLIKITRDHSNIRVHTRSKAKSRGGWEGWAHYPAAELHTRNTYYDFQVMPDV